MDAATLSAIASCIAALGVFLNAIQGLLALRQAQRATAFGQKNHDAIQIVDNKVDVVSENVDGHLSRMTDIVAGIDPVATRAAARELREEAKEEAAVVVATAKIAANQVIKDASEPH
jgi:hypothetical protein